MTVERMRIFSLNNRGVNLVIIIATSILAFCRSLANGFVWDDTIYFIGQRPYIDYNLKEIFFSLGNGVEYLPIRDLSLVIGHILWGRNPTGFHLENLVIHTATSCLLYLYLLKIARLADSNREKANSNYFNMFPLVAALIFAIHPLQAQAVNFITCRNTLLSGFFSILSLMLYLNIIASSGRINRFHYVVSIASLTAAMLSKATSIILPPLLMLQLIFIQDRKVLKRNILLGTPFWIISAFCFYIHINAAQTSNIVDSEQVTLLSARTATAVQIPWFYIGKFLFPVRLSPEYDVRFAQLLSEPAVISAFAGVIFLVAAAFFFWRKASLLTFGIAWYLISLGPVLNLFATNPVVADRYAYLPVIGLSIAAASLSANLARRINSLFVKTIFAFALIVLIVLSNRETVAWKSDETLWTHGIQNSPAIGKNYSNLGVYYFYRKQYDKAFPLFLKLRDLDYPWNDYDYYTAVLDVERGDLNKAVTLLKRVTDDNNRYDRAFLLLGTVYEKLGDNESALINYSKGLSVINFTGKGERETYEKRRARLLVNLRRELDVMRQRVNTDPLNIRARGELALKLDRLLFYEDALKEYRELERLGMKGWELQYNLGNVLTKLNRLIEAEQAFRNCIAMNPNNKDAFNNLGTLLNKRKDYAGAIQAFRQAITIDPGYRMARFNVISTYVALGDFTEASRLARELVAAFPELKPKVEILLKQ